MSANTVLFLTCFAAALIGAATGTALVWRLLLQGANDKPKADPALQEMLHRMPALLQQTLKADSDLYAQRQSERDGAQSSRLERWQAEQEQLAARREERSAAELHGVLEALEVLKVLARRSKLPPPLSPVSPLSRPSPQPPVVVERSVQSPTDVLPMSARPPELMQTPLPRVEPVYSATVPTRELTDEEIDALPADLPELTLPRKRILPSPRKPTLRNL
ncbi:hypothetical protein BH11PSE13_BH11PSE13_39430 [soil metagenome]